MPLGPEHQLQIACKKWTREAVACEHEFLAHDRTRKNSPMQHIAEKRRGIQSGTPDSQLLWAGQSLWAEFKSRVGVVSDIQADMHLRMQRTGHQVAVVRSVVDYAHTCLARGVPLRAAALERAEAADRGLLVIAQQPNKPPVKSRPGMRAKVTPRALAVLARARSAGVLI